MDITASNYFMDITEKGFRFFFYSYKIGIQRLDNGKRTLPSFDRVITSDKYIFVETNEHWGILDMDLSLIVPPIYKELIPVMQIDRDTFISFCISNQSAASITLNTNNNKIRISANNIDELRISSVARSPDEIAAYYNAAKSLIVE